MYFFIVLIIGFFIPFLFIRVKKLWTIWIPSYLFLLIGIGMTIKVSFFPAPEMIVLAEFIYLMITAVALFGSILGGIVIKLTR